MASRSSPSSNSWMGLKEQEAARVYQGAFYSDYLPRGWMNLPRSHLWPPKELVFQSLMICAEVFIQLPLDRITEWLQHSRFKLLILLTANIPNQLSTWLYSVRPLAEASRRRRAKRWRGRGPTEGQCNVHEEGHRQQQWRQVRQQLRQKNKQFYAFYCEELTVTRALTTETRLYRLTDCRPKFAPDTTGPLATR